MTNDGGNFYYFRCRPIRAERLRPHESRRRLDVFYIHFVAAPGAPRRAPPLTNGLGVLLDELFKVLPRRGRVVTLNKDKPRARHRGRRAFFIAPLLRVSRFHFAPFCATSSAHSVIVRRRIRLCACRDEDVDFIYVKRADLVRVRRHSEILQDRIAWVFSAFLSQQTPRSPSIRESNFYP